MNYTYNFKQILRTPLKPLKTSFSKEVLQHLFSEREVQEALFLASPNLLNECKKWLNQDITDKKEEEKLIISLQKYALRMHSRCTPYGLFAGCGVINNPTQNIVLNQKKRRRSTRLDMNFTCVLAQKLARLPFIEPYLEFYPNNSIYYLQDKIRYVEYQYKENKRIHQISAVDNSVYLQTILQKAQQGASLYELAQSITHGKITTIEAFEFLKELVNAQLIVSELEQAITGEDSLSQILIVLKKIQKQQFNIELKYILELLLDFQRQLAFIDQQIGNDITIYENLARKIEQLNIPIELNKLFQTDYFTSIRLIDKSTCNGQHQTPLNNNIQKQLIQAIIVLNKISSKPTKTRIIEFKTKFKERYQDKEIPVLEALDVETGIGYIQHNDRYGNTNSLVKNLILPKNMQKESELKWNEKQSFLFQKLLEGLKNNQYIISINHSEIDKFQENWNDIPDSFSIMFKHIGKREEKHILSIDIVGGSSATYLISRFASSNKEIEEIVTEIATKEQENQPQAILAEIVHLPENRIGNVITRPAFRKYEIPYLTKSSLPQEQQIPLSDLYLSIKNNQIYLRSKRLNKEIIPRLGNAHNYSFNALPTYQFLCDLQFQNLRGSLYFDWGVLKNEFSFLPRVEVGNVIISSATWQLKKEQFQELFEKKESILNLTKKWKEKWQMPDLILLVDGDNELLINLTDELSLKMFVAEIKKRPNINLKEFLFDEKTALVRDEQGNAYTNEFIAILQKGTFQYNEYKENKTLVPITNKTTKTVRSFSLGSEWLYYKIYCGEKTADTILAEVIKPLTEHLLEQQLIDGWFFIRYADPEVHLRVRFHLTDLKHIGAVIQLFKNAIAEYEQTGLVWKVQIDTYQREIERYGANTMMLSEQLFYYDSKCIVDMLDMIDGDEGEEIRWRFAIRAVDELLVSFNYSTEQKRDFMESLKTVFASEFNMDKNLKIQLDKKFRIHRNSISTILDKTNDQASELQPLFELLKQKSRNIIPLVTEILTIQQNNQLQLHINDLLASYIHMLLNRLFKNKQRMHEMVIYDFMWRTYHSEIAKQKHLKKQVVN